MVRRNMTARQTCTWVPINLARCTPTSAQVVRLQPLVTDKSRQRTTMTLSSTRRYEAATCQTSMLIFQNRNKFITRGFEIPIQNPLDRYYTFLPPSSSSLHSTYVLSNKRCPVRLSVCLSHTTDLLKIGFSTFSGEQATGWLRWGYNVKGQGHYEGKWENCQKCIDLCQTETCVICNTFSMH